MRALFYLSGFGAEGGCGRLYGITILQTYRYYRMNGGDPVYMRVSVSSFA